MNPDDLIKAAPELAKGAAALGAAIPFTAIVKRMFGLASDEVAEMWRDQVRVYRYGRQLKLLEKAERMATVAGFTPQPVPPKILFPLLEGASFEDNEDLHTMWAALLANAASSEKAEKVRPSFIAILRQMDPHEAVVLNRIYEDAEIEVTNENEFRRYGLDLRDFSQGTPKRQTIPETFEDALRAEFSAKIGQLSDVLLSLDALMAQQLVSKTYWKEEGDGVFTEVEAPRANEVGYTFKLTRRGGAFISACRPPKPRS